MERRRSNSIYRTSESAGFSAGAAVVVVADVAAACVADVVVANAVVAFGGDVVAVDAYRDDVVAVDADVVAVEDVVEVGDNRNKCFRPLKTISLEEWKREEEEENKSPSEGAVVVVVAVVREMMGMRSFEAKGRNWS